MTRFALTPLTGVASIPSGTFDDVLVPTVVKTANYTAAVKDFVPVDTTAGAVTITLPTAPADKSRIAIKHVIQGGTNVVTYACGGSDVFNKAGGATSGTLTLLAQAVILQYKASTGIWYIQADDLPLSQLDLRFQATIPAGTYVKVEAGRIVSIGHSYAEGNAGITKSSRRYTSRLAGTLHAEEICIGKGAAIMAGAETDTFTGFSTTVARPGGYAAVNQVVVPSVDDCAFADLFVINGGINDLYTESVVSDSVAFAKVALRSMIARARCGRVYENTDASVVYGGTWSAVTASQTGVASGANRHDTTAVSATATITVPATFIGGEIVLAGLVAAGKGSQFTVAVDGGATTTYDFRTGNGSTGRTIPWIVRLAGLAAGAHTIVLTTLAFAAAGGSCIFDWWGTTARDLPRVVVCNQFAATMAAAGANHTPVAPADIVLLNAALAALVAEFDATVTLADVATAFVGQTQCIYSDGVHPNEAGHGLILRTILRAVGPGGSQANAGMPPLRRYFGGAGEPAYTSPWTASTSGNFDGGNYQKVNGVVSLHGLVKKGSAGTPGETITTLPNGCRPANNLELKVSVPGATPATGTVDILPTGAILWYTGDPTSFFSLDGITFAADG